MQALQAAAQVGQTKAAAHAGAPASASADGKATAVAANAPAANATAAPAADAKMSSAVADAKQWAQMSLELSCAFQADAATGAAARNVREALNGPGGGLAVANVGPEAVQNGNRRIDHHADALKFEQRPSK